MEGYITVTKVFRFSYAHYLDKYDGVCNEVHGHNAKVEIEIQDPNWANNTPGIMFDFAELKKLVKSQVIDVLDHKLTNEVREFPDNPTAENFCKWIQYRLQSVIEGIKPKSSLRRVIRVRFYETDDSFAEWRVYNEQ